jgi:hypothetical protein
MSADEDVCSQFSPLTVEQPNQGLSVPERVVDRMMIVLGSAKTLPFLRTVKIADEPCVEISDPSPGVPKRVHAEVAPEIEVDPLEVVGGLSDANTTAGFEASPCMREPNGASRKVTEFS